MEEIEEEGEMSNFEDPVPADDPVNEFDPDPDISQKGNNILVSKKTIIETEGPKRFERESEGDRGKKTELESKCDSTSQSHNQTSNIKSSRSGKKGKGNQDNHNPPHAEQQNHSHKARNQSKGHQNQAHELQTHELQIRNDQLGRHEQQGFKSQSNEPQGRQNKGKDQGQNKVQDQAQHQNKGQDQGQQNKGQDQSKGQDQGQQSKGQDQGHHHKNNDQPQQNKSHDQGQQNKSSDSSQQNKGQDSKNDQSRSNQQSRRGQGSDQQSGSQRQQGSKKSQGGNRTHDQSHVRIDSMTVRNRNAFRQGKNNGTSGTPVENKRSSISDSGESCSLELPYKIKSSDTSGKKSPVFTTGTYSTGYLDLSQPSTGLNNSQQDPPPAPPPPIKMWETSFSEVVARGEHTYSTVARMGSKVSMASTSTSSSTLTVTTSSTSDSVPEVCTPANMERLSVEQNAQSGALDNVCAEFVPNGCTDSQNLALMTFTMKDNVFKAPCSPHDGAHQSPEQKKELGPIGPRKKPAGQNTAIIAPWTENGASSLVPQPPSSPVVSSIFLREGLREGLREPYDAYPAMPPQVMDTLKEDQYARYSLENRSPSTMSSEYPLEQSSSYENVYDQYHDPEGHYSGTRPQQQQQQQQQQLIGPFDSIRPPLYVGPSSYSINRVVDHQMEHPMDLNGDLLHEPCDQRVEQGFDQSYDQSFDQSYDQQFDQASLKQQSSQQIIGGQQHQIDMLVQQFQQQSMQSHPQYPSVHQIKLQQQRQLPQTHLQPQQPPQQQQPPPPPQPQQSAQQNQPQSQSQQQQLSMHMYQQQQIGPQGQAVVVIGGQRNIIGEAGIMPYMWLDQQSAQAAQAVQVQQQIAQPQQTTLAHPLTQLSQQIAHHLPQAISQHSPKPIQMPSQYSQHQFPQQPAVSPQTLAQQMQQYHLQQQQLQQSQQSQQQQQIHQQPQVQVQQTTQQHIAQHHQQQVTQQLHLMQEERNNVVEDEHQPSRFRAENWQRVSSPWDKTSSSGPTSTTAPIMGSRAAPGNAPGNVPSHGNAVGSSLGTLGNSLGSSIGNVLGNAIGNSLSGSPGIVSESTVGQPVQFKANEVRSSGRDMGIESMPNAARNGSLWGAVGESWIGTADVGTVSSARSAAPPSSATSTSTIGTSSSNCLPTTSSSIWSSESLLGISRPYTRERPATAQGTTAQRQEENTFDPFRSRTISNIWSSKTSGK